MAALLESEVYSSQRALAGRLAPADDVVRTILTGVQRLLNVDGYQVLMVDEETGVVMEEMELLRGQSEVMCRE